MERLAALPRVRGPFRLHLHGLHRDQRAADRQRARCRARRSTRCRGRITGVSPGLGSLRRLGPAPSALVTNGPPMHGSPPMRVSPIRTQPDGTRKMRTRSLQRIPTEGPLPQIARPLERTPDRLQAGMPTSLSLRRGRHTLVRARRRSLGATPRVAPTRRTHTRGARQC